jgi:hypothetical protein
MIHYSWWLSYRDLNLRRSFKQLSDRFGSFASLRKHDQGTMVLSILIAIIAAPGLLGSSEAIRQSQSQEKREEHRARRCNLVVTCVKSSGRSRELNGRIVVLRNGKLYIDTGTEDGAPLGHPYAGYYLPYPDSEHEGLVTTITDVAPVMNWVYIDKKTHEAKYGVRVDAQPNLTGPFSCTRQDRRMTFAGWEGWCAVEEAPGLWAVYFDVSDDGLRSKVAPGTRVLEIELCRKEKRFQKEASVRQQDQTTKRAVDVKQDAPVDQPLSMNPAVSRPGVHDHIPQGQAEPEKPKPFRIPRSIFENPPPTLETATFERPLTPPPAYSTTERPVSPILSVPAAVSEPINPRPETEPVANTTSSTLQKSEKPDKPNESTPSPQAKPSPPFQSSPNRSTSPSASMNTPPPERRTTPKLNRSSGTRALAQAQMFEAMAAGQKPKVDMEPGRSRSISRATSTADSSSDYSRDGQDINEEAIPALETLPGISPTPAPLAPLPLRTRPSFQRAETQAPSRSTPPTQRPKTPPRQRALTNPMDPAIFGKAPTQRTASREPLRKPSTTFTSRPSTSRSSSQASPRPPLDRRGMTSDSIASPRAPLDRRDTTSDRMASPRAPLERRDTTSDRMASPRAPLERRGTATGSPRPAVRSAAQTPQAASRSLLASTMTTGRGNRGMTAKVGGSGSVSGERGRGRSVISQSSAQGSGRSATLSPAQGSGKSGTARKTTSALFREIDELVGKDDGGKAGGD